MRLTEKEREIMEVLWENESPMTVVEIIEASPNRTWKDNSIHVMLRTMQTKNLVVLESFVPTGGRAAGAYKAAVTREEYAILFLQELNVNFDLFTAANVYSRKICNACRNRASVALNTEKG